MGSRRAANGEPPPPCLDEASRSDFLTMSGPHSSALLALLEPIRPLLIPRFCPPIITDGRA